MTIIDHFGILAPIYDRVIKTGDSHKLMVLTGLPAQGRLLDAGGGTGRIAQVVKGKITQVVVADLSIGMLRQAAAKNGLQTTCAQTEALPFPDGTFDRVTMVDAMHHVYDQVSSALELWRVLKPGGRIVIEEPDIRFYVVKITALIEKLVLMRSHFIPPSKIKALFGYPDAHSQIIQEGYTSWVIVDKLGSTDTREHLPG